MGTGGYHHFSRHLLFLGRRIHAHFIIILVRKPLNIILNSQIDTCRFVRIISHELPNEYGTNSGRPHHLSVTCHSLP